jgi:hypothetical protein
MEQVIADVVNRLDVDVMLTAFPNEQVVGHVAWPGFPLTLTEPLHTNRRFPRRIDG